MRQNTIILLALMLIGATHCHAQSQDRSIAVSYGYQTHTSDPGTRLSGHNYYPTTLSEAHTGSLHVDANLWHLGHGITMGLYGGLAPAYYYADSNSMDLSLQVRYGIRAQMHLLPFMGVDTDKWDVSLNATVGSMRCIGASRQSEFGLGITAAYYPWKHIGIFVESDWGSYRFTQKRMPLLLESHSLLKAGLTIRY